MASTVIRLSCIAATAAAVDWFPCPDLYAGTPITPFEEVPSEEDFVAALGDLDVDALRADMTSLLTDSQPCWPADFGNYVGLFSRLSWHAAGTFRDTDGAGGAGGGRQRFDPEASWEDNTNLDKARALLGPMKRKYGSALSWADLIALAGTHAMWNQGAPLSRFCFGRLDEWSGEASLPLGPSPIQEEVAPCTGPPGDCQLRANETLLAPVKVGLIYVNPEGPLGNASDLSGSAMDIRTVFGKMGAGARATVALIGGGHAFGKTHGACSDREFAHPAGSPPNEAREANEFPYMGTCPSVAGGTTGTGLSTWTSGFEGPWTSNPTRWSNEFFQMLLDEEWELWEGPGGHQQWRLAGNPSDPRMRLTADIALLHDPEFKRWVEVFARNLTSLGESFDEAWDDLIHSGGGWASERRCVALGAPPGVAAAAPTMLNTDTTTAEAELMSGAPSQNITITTTAEAEVMSGARSQGGGALVLLTCMALLRMGVQ